MTAAVEGGEWSAARPGHTLHAKRYKFMIISSYIHLGVRMFQTKVVEKVKTHILCSITVFPKSCRLWDNMENYSRAGRPQMAVQCGAWRIAWWVTVARDTTENM